MSIARLRLVCVAAGVLLVGCFDPRLAACGLTCAQPADCEAPARCVEIALGERRCLSSEDVATCGGGLIDAAMEPPPTCGGLGLLDGSDLSYATWYGQRGISGSRPATVFSSTNTITARLGSRFVHEIAGGAVEIDVASRSGLQAFELALEGFDPRGTAGKLAVGVDDAGAYSSLEQAGTTTFVRGLPVEAPFTLRLTEGPEGLVGEVVARGTPQVVFAPRPLPAALVRARVALELVPRCPDGACATSTTISAIRATGLASLCPLDELQTPEVPIDRTRWLLAGGCTYRTVGGHVELTAPSDPADCSLTYRLPTDLRTAVTLEVVHPFQVGLVFAYSLVNAGADRVAALGIDGLGDASRALAASGTREVQAIVGSSAITQQTPWRLRLLVDLFDLKWQDEGGTPSVTRTIHEEVRADALPAGPLTFALQLKFATPAGGATIEPVRFSISPPPR